MCTASISAWMAQFTLTLGNVPLKSCSIDPDRDPARLLPSSLPVGARARPPLTKDVDD
jgi:hypothetical protein